MKSRLEDLPNVGKSIAGDLRAIGIRSPEDLRGKNPLLVFDQLETVMQHRHDPCVYYTLLSAKHFLETEEKLPWWKFTAEGKKALQGRRTGG